MSNNSGAIRPKRGTTSYPLTDASGLDSEPEDRTKRNPQVVVRAVVEVDLVANFKTQTHRTQARLHSSSGIHCRV
jgi:hypothetical protein